MWVPAQSGNISIASIRAKIEATVKSYISRGALIKRLCGVLPDFLHKWSVPLCRTGTTEENLEARFRTRYKSFPSGNSLSTEEENMAASVCSSQTRRSSRDSGVKKPDYPISFRLRVISVWDSYVSAYSP